MQTIGILEYIETNHVQTVNALIKSYCTLPDTKIIVFASQEVNKELEHFSVNKLCERVVQTQSETKAQFLKRVSDLTTSRPLKRLHICSTTEEYNNLSSFKPKSNEIALHIHNTEEWFDNSPKYHLDTLVHDLKYDQSQRKKSRIIARFLYNITAKRAQIHKCLLNWRKNSEVKLFVQNSNIAKTLEAKHPKLEGNIVIFPFSCYEPNTNHQYENNTSVTNANTKLKIGICGTITQERRDYLGFFNILENSDIKDFEFLLLGTFNPREEKRFLTRIQELQSKGIKVLPVAGTKNAKSYEQAMSNCDLLLNLVKLQKSAHSIYGKTKESGMIGDMIRSANPGLIPEGYFTEDEFKLSTVKYKSLEELISILQTLKDNPPKLEILKRQALLASQAYLPTKLCRKL